MDVLDIIFSRLKVDLDRGRLEMGLERDGLVVRLNTYMLDSYNLAGCFFNAFVHYTKAATYINTHQLVSRGSLKTGYDEKYSRPSSSRTW